LDLNSTVVDGDVAEAFLNALKTNTTLTELKHTGVGNQWDDIDELVLYNKVKTVTTLWPGVHRNLRLPLQHRIEAFLVATSGTFPRWHLPPEMQNIVVEQWIMVEFDGA